MQPDRQTPWLSDAFEKKTKRNQELELKVLMLNINFGHNKELMDKSRTLRSMPNTWIGSGNMRS